MFRFNDQKMFICSRVEPKKNIIPVFTYQSWILMAIKEHWVKMVAVGTFFNKTKKLGPCVILPRLETRQI